MIKNGNKGELVKNLQEGLKKLGYHISKIDGIFGDKTEKAVIEFQEDHGLYADGIVGDITASELRKALEVDFDEQMPPVSSPDAGNDLMEWVRVPADKYRDGYDRFFLREDAAEAYLNVREQVLEAGGLLTSSGARRSLTAHVSPSRSATSFHYTGLALDLFVGSGMENTHRNPFIIVSEGDRYWRVFVKADGGTEMELQAITYGSRKSPKPVTGKFVDVTQLFEVAGFKRIRARKSFFNGGTWLGAEWWHFQYEQALEKGVSTFGGELLKVYTEKQLQNTPPWKFRNRVFGKDWF